MKVDRASISLWKYRIGFSEKIILIPVLTATTVCNSDGLMFSFQV